MRARPLLIAAALAPARHSQLAAHRTLAQLHGSQWLANVSRLKALGGGWQVGLR
jgi:outer membrane protein TolC